MPASTAHLVRAVAAYRGICTRSHAVLALLGLTVGALAAPLFPDKPVLPDPIRSLAGLDVVALQVKPLPAELKATGLTIASITGRIRDRLQQGGVRVVEQDVPDGTTRLVIETVVSTDASVKDAVAFAYMIDVQQDARVNRIDEVLDVSTYVAWILDVKDRELLPEAARENLDTVVKGLMRQIDQATDQK